MYTVKTISKCVWLAQNNIWIWSAILLELAGILQIVSDSLITVDLSY